LSGHIKKRTYRNGRIAWRARYPDPDRPTPTAQIEREFRTKQEAEAWLTAQAHSVMTGSHINPQMNDLPFRELADAWRETWTDLAPKTRTGYESILKHHVIPAWGNRQIGTITPTAVQAYVNRLAQDAGAATVRNVAAVLRRAFAAGVKLGLTKANPAERVRLPKAPHREQLFLTAAQVHDLAGAMAPHYRPLVLTAAFTGLRAGELAGLRRRDVDLLRGTLRVEQAVSEIGGTLHTGPPKTPRSRRTVALPAFLTRVLNDHLTRSSSPAATADALVFTTPTGTPLRHNLFYKRHFKPAVVGRPATATRPAVPGALPPELAGLRFHDLRHTAVALAIAAGAHPKTIADRMGHSSIQITMDRYGHLFPSADEALAAALDAHAPAPPAGEVVGLRG
jgi:integrase